MLKNVERSFASGCGTYSGSTGGWPRTLNMWEEDGWKGLSESFAGETVGAGAQDPELAKWWSAASEFRSGGHDRIVVPALWSPTTEELMEAAPLGVAYAHETIKVETNEAPEVLEIARERLSVSYGKFGLKLVGAFRTALRLDDEAILIWAIPSWESWAGFEECWSGIDQESKPGVALNDLTVIDHSRFLMTDSLLNPTRTGRQPAYSDQRPFE